MGKMTDQHFYVNRHNFRIEYERINEKSVNFTVFASNSRPNIMVGRGNSSTKVIAATHAVNMAREWAKK